jgi:hypothetical protein
MNEGIDISMRIFGKALSNQVAKYVKAINTTTILQLLTMLLIKK